MSAVRSRGTRSEIDLRRRLSALGFRYRVNVRDLPGRPDIVFPKYKSVVFIHGCFWHSHECPFGAAPQTRRVWWKRKLEGNRVRDQDVLAILHGVGWRTAVVWECSFRGAGAKRDTTLDSIARRIAVFVRSRRRHLEIAGKTAKGAGNPRRGD